MQRARMNQFEKLSLQMKSAHKELSALTATDELGKFRRGLVEEILKQADEFLESAERRPFDQREELEDTQKLGDAVFLLGQYMQCFEKWRTDHVVSRHGGWYWSVDREGGDGKVDHVPTPRPESLRGPATGT